MVMTLLTRPKKTVATVVIATDGSGDTTDIQTGINLLPATGGCVYIKEGTYDITERIIINVSGTTIHGCGDSTIIRVMGPMNEVIYANSLNHLDIESFRINLNTQNGVRGIRLLICTYCRIFNVTVNNGFNNNEAIRIDAGGSNLISECDCSDNVGRGIYVAEPNSIVMNCTCNNNDPSDGIFFSGAGRCIIIGNTCVGNAIAGINLNQGEGAIVSNNICNSNVLGILIGSNVVKSIVSNNVMELNDRAGIYSTGSEYCMISNNMLTNNNQDTSVAYPESEIILRSTSIHTTVEGNIITADTAKYGIREFAAVDNYNLIIGNKVLGATTAQISIQGANTEIAHNITT